MVHFAAVLGIDEEGGRLRKGEECSFIMAGFLYCIRVLFVEYTLPAATRAEQTQVDIDRFLELRQKYLVVGGYYPQCSFGGRSVTGFRANKNPGFLVEIKRTTPLQQSSPRVLILPQKPRWGVV